MKTFLTYVGTAAAALAASACCWIPALLGAGAAGSLGVSAVLAPWRPYLLGLTGLFLLGGFWTVYRKPKAECCDAGGCATPSAAKRRRINIGVMWAVAVFALAMAAYPNFLAAQAAVQQGRPSSESATAASVLAFKVTGMDCEGCAAPIRTELEKVPGVVTARVDFEHGKALVSVKNPPPKTETLLAAIKRAGFEAKYVGETQR